MTVDKLRKLKWATNEAIEAVRKEDIPEAVDWANLRCVNAQWIVDDEGNKHAAVVVDEASPEAGLLQAAIRAELERLGWPDVRVVTEW